MAELTGAVALVQLGKMDSLLARMHKNKALIKSAIKDIKGLEFREIPNPEGDTAICLVLYLPTPVPIIKDRR